MHGHIRFVLLLSAAFNTRDSAAQEPKTTHVLLHLYTGLSAVMPRAEEMKNTGHKGIVATHYRSGWGLAFGHQKLEWRGEGPSLHVHGWFGNFTTEPESKLEAKSWRVVKEFHLRSTPLFRPCLEAGVSSIRYRHDELVNEGTPEEPYMRYEIRTENVLGFDARIRAFLPFTRAFAFEAAYHINVNEYYAYSAAEFGFALGLVRPPKARKKV